MYSPRAAPRSTLSHPSSRPNPSRPISRFLSAFEPQIISREKQTVQAVNLQLIRELHGFLISHAQLWQQESKTGVHAKLEGRFYCAHEGSTFALEIHAFE